MSINLPKQLFGFTIPWQIAITFIISSVIFFGYYYFFHPLKLQLLYQSWDGPAYVIVAKSFYNPETIARVNTVGLPSAYFANYFPLYPAFIKLLSFAGYWRSSILVTQFFTLLTAIAIYNLLKTIYPKEQLNWIAIPLLFFPARWFSITHIGSSEPLFLFLVTLSLISLVKRQYLISAIVLAAAQFTRHAAIWYFAGLTAYFFYNWATRKLTTTQALKAYFPFLLVPLSFGAVNLIFYLRYGDFSFWSANLQKASYFQPTPFKIFSLYTGGIWRESLVFNYLMYLGGTLLLFKERKYNFATLALFNFLPLLFFVQEDLSRIALSGLPLLFLAYHRVIGNKLFQAALLLLSPAIYLYSFQFLNYNLSP